MKHVNVGSRRRQQILDSRGIGALRTRGQAISKSEQAQALILSGGHRVCGNLARVVLRMQNQGAARQLNVIVSLETRNDGRNPRYEQRFEVIVRDIARRYEEKLRRFTGQEKRVHEIGIFGNDHTLLTCGNFINLSVGSSIALRQVQGMSNVVTSIP